MTRRARPSRGKAFSVLQLGYMKSGNYWLWNIIEAALAEAGVPRRSFLRSQSIYKISKDWQLAFDGEGTIDMIDIRRDAQMYVIPPVFCWPIFDLDDYVRSCSHVWTHSELLRGTAKHFRKFGKLVMIVRDPRDVALSVCRFDANAFRRKFYGTVPGEVPRPPFAWGATVEGFVREARSLGIHTVFYERLVHAWEPELDRLLAYLELDVDARGRRAIENRTRVGEMKKKSAMHVAKGQAYGWASDLDPHLQAEFTAVHERMLRLLGYPLTAADARALQLPAFPSAPALNADRGTA
jgi:aryl sulfotransferase